MTKYCNQCGFQLKGNDKFCEKCGAEQNTINKNQIINTNNNEIKYNKSPLIPLLLTFFLQPLGQFYNGQILKGLLFLLISIVLYKIFFWLGILFWLFMVYDAYNTAKNIKDNNGNYFFNENIKSEGV